MLKWTDNSRTHWGHVGSTAQGHAVEFEIEYNGICADLGLDAFELTVWDYVTPVEGEDIGYGVAVFSAPMPSVAAARMCAEHWGAK